MNSHRLFEGLRVIFDSCCEAGSVRNEADRGEQCLSVKLDFVLWVWGAAGWPGLDFGCCWETIPCEFFTFLFGGE